MTLTCWKCRKGVGSAEVRCHHCGARLQSAPKAHRAALAAAHAIDTMLRHSEPEARAAVLGDPEFIARMAALILAAFDGVE